MESQGLTFKEAESRLLKYGRNEIVSSGGIKPLVIFLSQFKSFLILILIAATPVAFFAGERLDAFFILVIILLNGLFGFIQEYRAERAIAALKKMVVERVRVIREGQEIEIDSKELVPGDVFIIDEGQKIPADARLIESFSLSLNEAPLTGESSAVDKEPISSSQNDDKGLVFMGTSVEQGQGKAEVLTTGMDTRFGKIALLLKEIKDEETPLQKHLTVLGKQLGIAAIFGSVLIVIVGVFYGKQIIEMLLTGASLAVAVVPEGLPAVVTITLAIGVQRMARVSSIVRRLSSIEAIGSVDVILSDKTGTITKNEMAVNRIWVENSTHEVKNVPSDSESLKRILEISVLCSTASLSHSEKGQTKILGDRTEGALLVLVQNKGLDINALRGDGKFINQFPFNSNVKRMSVIWAGNLRNQEVLAKGAPEIILDASTKIFLNGKTQGIDDGLRASLEKTIEEEASQGYRLLAFAFKEFKGEGRNTTREEAEKELIFLGFVAIYDPPREAVKDAIGLASKAGITVAMITGDNPLTAKAVGVEIGLASQDTEVLTGKDLDTLSEKELQKKTESVRIFARVSPEHKLRIVEAFQARGFSVAVTGDGVNDSPALKAADVGMAMGIIGTDVAKEASDMVIADDNFNSIVKAVEEGRVVYENILRSIKYLLSCNSGELLAIVGSIAIGLPSPLTPIQILWMNLVTDGLPALALAEDPKNPHTMLHPPRDKKASIVQVAGKSWMLLVGAILAIATVSAFVLSSRYFDSQQARTVSFSTLVLGEMAVVFLVRRGEGLTSNKFLIGSVLVTVLLQILIVSFPPLQSIFDTRLPF